MHIFTFLGLSLLAVAIAIIGWSLLPTVSAWQILSGKTLIITGNVFLGGVIVLFLKR